MRDCLLQQVNQGLDGGKSGGHRSFLDGDSEFHENLLSNCQVSSQQVKSSSPFSGGFAAASPGAPAPSLPVALNA